MLLSLRSAKHLLFVVFLLLSTAIFSFAQITNVTDNQSTPTPGAGHDYIQMVNETVNPGNGSVSIRIGVPVPPGRGLTLPFAFAYDSNGVHIPYSGLGQGEWSSGISFLSQGGWSYSAPQMSYQIGNFAMGSIDKCFFSSAFVFFDPSGGRHALGVAEGTDLNQDMPCGRQIALGGDDYVQAYLSAGYQGDVYSVSVADADGTAYAFQGSLFHGDPAPNGSTFQALPAYVEDRNGNRIVVTDSGNGAFTMTDTAGRASIVSSGFGSSGNTVTVSGLTNPYTVTWGTATSSFSPNAAYVVNDGRCRGFSGDAETQNVITAIELPNGQSYQFYYDSGTSGNSGLLNEIVYPSGGWVKYTWGYPPTYNEFAT